MSARKANWNWTRRKSKDKFAEDPEAVEKFFTEEELGFAEKFDAVIESIAGVSNSLLITRNDTCRRRSNAHTRTDRLLQSAAGRERERLLLYYYNLEIAISKIKANMSVVESSARPDYDAQQFHRRNGTMKCCREGLCMSPVRLATRIWKLKSARPLPNDSA